MAYRYSREASTVSSHHRITSTPLPEDYANVAQLTTGDGYGTGGFEVIPEEVAVTDYTGVQLASGQRQAEVALASWRVGKAPSTSLTSGLSLSTRSSDIDLKEFLVQRGNYQLQSLHKAAAQGDQASIMHIMKQLGPEAPINELDANGCTPLMYAVMADSRLAIEMLLNFSARREQTDPEGRTAVHYAAFFGKHKSLKFLVDTAADWASRDVYGRTPLHWASVSKGTRSLLVLLKHAQTVFGDINPRDNEGMTPLHCAAQFGRPRNIVLLSEAKCDLTAVDVEEKTALHWTAGNHDSACLQALLDMYPPLMNRTDINGSTILHLTASNGAAYLVEALLRVAGIDIDLKDNAERTPLHCCSLEGHSEIVQLLLTFGALDSCIDTYGLTALHYAVQSKSTASVRAFSQLENMSHLPDGNEGRTPLMLAAQSGSEQMVKALLQNQATVKTIDHTDNDGRTALHLASQSGSAGCTSLLLSHGANPNLQDSLQQTPLLAACIEGHTTCIHPLIRGGAESTLLDADGHTPLVKAVLYNHPLVVQALVSAEVDLNMQDSSGTTAAHVAAYSGNDIILSTLLENGADPNTQDINGLSVAHMAALEGHTHCVTVLASHRAYLNFTDYSSDRYTPLDYAINYGHTECADELRRNGAVSVHNIKDMAAVCIQTCYRGFRARKLRVMLIQQNKAATVLASHVRRHLQQKRYQEMKKRHYAAIKIQAAFRGYQQRLRFQAERKDFLELEKKRTLIENFAKLVMSQRESMKPLTRTEYGEGRELGAASDEQQAKEQQARLEAAMKMREVYEEKQRRWEEFRAAEMQRRIDMAKQAELERLAGILSERKARREYAQVKFKHTLTVRTHYQAAVVIQRSFRAMRLRKSWQRRVQARLETAKRKRENEAAITIQCAWRRYRQYKIYQATCFKSVYTDPVIPLHEIHAQVNQGPSYEKSISITGNPRRKIHETKLSGFRVPRPTTQDLILRHTRHTPSQAATPCPFSFQPQTWRQTANQLKPPPLKRQSLPTSVFKFSPGKKREGRILPELFPSQASPSKIPKTKSYRSTRCPPFLPEIVPT